MMLDFLDLFLVPKTIKKLLDSKEWHNECDYQFVESLSLDDDNNIDMYFISKNHFSIGWKQASYDNGTLMVYRKYIDLYPDKVDIRITETSLSYNTIDRLNIIVVEYNSTEEYLFQLSTLYDIGDLSTLDIERLIKIKDIYLG